MSGQKTRLSLFDTTLRDGQQTQGVDFSACDKAEIALALDALGLDYVEGGWPGANPTDSDFFRDAPTLKTATLTAFGMTHKIGVSAANDPVLTEVLDAGTPAVCLVGKTHEFHVTTALRADLSDNRRAIRQSVARLVEEGREALFDAEHFFDGYKANPDYALACLVDALEAGARWVVLCDTNGGTLTHEVSEIVAAVARRIPEDRLGIHTHNDAELAVANTLAAIDAGARQIQGTLNGLGERCGNANLVTLIPTLALKEPYASRYEIGVSPEALAELTKLSRKLDEILNRAPNRHAAYVGAAAFAHKAGLHASGVLRDPSTYEHVPPEAVGNARVVPMSNQAGRSNLLRRLNEAEIEVDKEDPRLTRLLQLVKEREDAGFAYDTAAASFEILARRELGLLPVFFDVERFRVTVEKRWDSTVDDRAIFSEAVVVLYVGGARKLSVSESLDPVSKSDQGPVNALWRALKRALDDYESHLRDVKLTDFRVRILSGGTEAVTRVLIDYVDGRGRSWSTVGLSANIVDASFQALDDAIVHKLLLDGATPPAGRRSEL